MFKFLREKISNWAKKISKRESEEPEKPKKTDKKKKEIPMPMKFSVGKQKYEPDLE